MLRIALGFRGRIYLTTLVIVGVFGLTSGVWLSSQLRAMRVAQLVRRLLLGMRTAVSRRRDIKWSMLTGGRATQTMRF